MTYNLDMIERRDDGFTVANSGELAGVEKIGSELHVEVKAPAVLVYVSCCSEKANR